jgi:hypothetical protein
MILKLVNCQPHYSTLSSPSRLSPSSAFVSACSSEVNLADDVGSAAVVAGGSRRCRLLLSTSRPHVQRAPNARHAFIPEIAAPHRNVLTCTAQHQQPGRPAGRQAGRQLASQMMMTAHVNARYS